MSPIVSASCYCGPYLAARLPPLIARLPGLPARLPICTHMDHMVYLAALITPRIASARGSRLQVLRSTYPPYVPVRTLTHEPHSTHTHTHTHENPSDTPAYLDIPPMLCGTSGQRVHPGRAGRTARRPSCLRAAKSPGGPQDKFPRERARGVCEPSGPCGRGHAAALTLQLRSARPPRRAQADCAPACPGGSPRPRARKQSRNSGDRATR